MTALLDKLAEAASYAEAHDYCIAKDAHKGQQRDGR